ncbi:unnamed protein product [Didymodactylos carnosus]|uniref:ACB domain-containing protein n=1 Tax=Didymodactylos carnosus TaxID=1234261 RepID=A0A813X8S4_9BILA|nr:unnamed protein product [Didymodactylos carnosus]CAF0872339.1 unnamed protein product [Didymodactylos carnosus]CAF3625844.1 unnamed protein product [Didymodactylos carnosus]CAF3659605.1 unnamed protein product [Didymodactylos carnosus]
MADIRYYFSNENAYIEHHYLSVYFEDCVRSLLETRRRSNALKFDINEYIRDYFNQIKLDQHVLGRDYQFIYFTPLNRKSFIGHLWTNYFTKQQEHCSTITLKEFHTNICTLCPDFPYTMVESAAQIIVDNVTSDCRIDYIDLLYAFQLRFFYDEFINETQVLFRTLKNRLNFHVPTENKANANTLTNNDKHEQTTQRTVLIEALEKLSTKVRFSFPPLSIINEILMSSDNNNSHYHHFNYNDFLSWLAKSEKLNQHIGKAPSTIKLFRKSSQSNVINTPTSPSQSITPDLLQKLPTTPPVLGQIALPPLTSISTSLQKQPTLIREKPIKQQQPANVNNIIMKRSQSASSVIKVNTIPDHDEQKHSESESESHSSAFQPSNEMKLTFYGLYKQATIGPSKEPRPAFYNYVNRAKWDSWNKYRLLTKDQAMTEYINEIRKILETMPQTNEVLEFTNLIGPFYEFVEDNPNNNKSMMMKKQAANKSITDKNLYNTLTNGFILYVVLVGNGDHLYSNGEPSTRNNVQQLATSGNAPSSPSSSSPPSSSDVDGEDVDIYDDPSDRLSLNQSPRDDEDQNFPTGINQHINNNFDNMIQDEQTDNVNSNQQLIVIDHHLNDQSNSPSPNHLLTIPQQTQPQYKRKKMNFNNQSTTNNNTRNSNASSITDGLLIKPSFHSVGGQNDSDHSSMNIRSSIRRTRGNNSNVSYRQLSSNSHRQPSENANAHSLNSLSNNGNGDRDHESDNNDGTNTQREILTMLIKLQHDVNNVLERLNRLETSTFIQNTIAPWLPLSGFRKQTAAFLLLWPFAVFAIIRLLLHAKVIIRLESNDIVQNEHLGIPKAVFVEDVDSFMQQSENPSADVVLKRLDDLNGKYRFMEMNLLQKKKRLKSKLPDIKMCLDMVEQLRKYREKNTNMETNFLLAHNLYGKAAIPPTDKVCLWLGANVMLEYTLDEAEELLQGNQKTAQSTMEKVDDDLDFLRDQITTTEVNMARLHNWNVKRKQTEKSQS